MIFMYLDIQQMARTCPPSRIIALQKAVVKICNLSK
jgi:hypothetical protein